MSVYDNLLENNFVIRRNFSIKSLDMYSVYIEDKIFKCMSTGTSECSYIRGILEKRNGDLIIFGLIRILHDFTPLRLVNIN